MPYKPKRPCGHPGCAELTQGRFCELHSKGNNSSYNRNSRDADSKKFYGGRAWRETSKRQLMREPLCAECLRAERMTAATLADHIQPIRDGGSRYDPENLQSLCKACHNRKH